VGYVVTVLLSKSGPIARGLIALALVGTLVSACGGGDDTEAASSDSPTTVEVTGTQQLMIEQEITVLDQKLVYPKKGVSQVSSMITTLEPGQETGWQLHRVPVFVYVLSGTYTVEYEAGVTKEFPAGSSTMQAIKTNYNGINKGEDSVQLLTVFMGAKGKKNIVMR
jgi:quercetin dioxygenase-like cupin family protein